jgi:hypothetical protein
MKAFISKDRLAAFYALLIALLLLIASFYGTDAEVYLFPRITAIFIAVLALILSYDAFNQGAPGGERETTLVDWKTLLPGLAVGIIYVVLLERVGFYTCSFFAFFAICMIYGKRSLFDPRAFVLKLLVTTVTMIILYVLFWKLLNVRTPTGILF